VASASLPLVKPSLSHNLNPLESTDLGEHVDFQSVGKVLVEHVLGRMEE